MSTKRKLPATLARPFVKQNAKKPSRTAIDETRTAVFSAGSAAAQKKAPAETDPIEISSDSSSNYDDLEEHSDDEEEEDVKPAKEEEMTSQNTPPPEDTRVIPNGDEAADVEMAELPPDDDLASDVEPTFGDLIRGSTTVDVAGALAAQQATPLSPLSGPAPSNRQIIPVSHASLGTVLNQALRTDDNDLLESCLQTTDYEVAMSTIQRMDSALAAKLLSKLAARMHRKPGRALVMMKWVQGTLIAHGGALAAQGDVLRKLADLNSVLEERSRGLTSLLALKGKLDLLYAQLELRQLNKAAGATGRKRGALDDEQQSEDEAEDGEEGIIYVEGEEEAGKSKMESFMHVSKSRSEDEEDDFPVVNGIDSDSEEDEESDDQEEEGIEELDDDELNDEIDHDDVESGDEESDGEAARPPAKLQKTSAGFAKRK